MKKSFALTALMAAASVVLNIYLAVFKHTGIESKIYIVNATAFMCLGMCSLIALMLDNAIEHLIKNNDENAK